MTLVTLLPWFAVCKKVDKMEIITWYVFSAGLIALLGLLYLWSKSSKSYWEKLGVPGPNPKPLFGNLIEIFEKPNNVLLVEWAKQYGPVYGYMEWNKPVLVVGDPNLLKDILIKDFHVFADRKPVLVDQRLNRLLPALRGHDWKRIRSLSSPAFTSSKIQLTIPAMTESVKTLLTILSNAESNEEFDLRNLFNAVTVDIFARCAYGIKSDAIRNTNDELLKRSIATTEFKLSSILLVNILPSWICKLLSVDVVPQDGYQYWEAMVQSMLDSYQEQTNHKNLFSLWIKSIKGDSDPNQCLSFDELVAQAYIFVTAGFETTASLLSYCFYTLAVEPEIQDRLYEEVTKHLESRSNTSNDDFSSIQYLNAFIDEALRMYTPVVHWDRVASQDYVLGETGIIVKKGTKVVTPFYAVHHDPNLYTDPETFRPERFLPENKHLLPKYAFLPFGYGPRNCIGMRFALQEARMIIAHTVRQFQVAKTEKTVPSPKYVGRYLILQTEPLIVRFCKRN